MRILVVVAIVALLVGCATDSAFSGYCTVYEIVGGKAEPLGLVRIPSQLESELRLQLPAGARSTYICWYASGENLIAGGRRNPGGGNSGYVFNKIGGSWVLNSTDPILLSLSSVIE
jgi:hypothetical protein